MNVIEFVALSIDFIKQQVLRNAHIGQYLIRLIIGTFQVGWTLLSIVGDHLWLFVIDVAHIGWLLICILSSVVLISFIKSLQPRYKFQRDSVKDFTDDLERKLIDGLVSKGQKAPGSRPFIEYTSHNQSSIEPTVYQKIIAKITNEYKNVNAICQRALTNSNIQSVYQQLSWSHTQIDLESVNWLNQTLTTLWPSVKTLLNKYVFDDLLKPKKVDDQKVLAASKGLAKKQARLSVYLSCRRKLDKLRRGECHGIVRHRGFLDNSVVVTIVFLLKLVIVYTKQFILDYILFLFKREVKNDCEEGIEINLKELIKKDLSNGEVKVKPRTGSQSWAGFDLASSRRNAKSWASLKRKRRKFMSAPGDFAINKTNRVLYGSTSFIGPRCMAKLREKRLKLAEKLNLAHTKLKKKDITFEKIKLGDSIPMLNGIKHIDESSDLYNETRTLGRRLRPSDNSNMRFMVELSYESDSKFLIRMNSLPLLGRIKIKKFGYQVRLLITINHTTTELDRDLEILATPGDVLFPAINHAHIALVDAPRVDWCLKRVNKKAKSLALKKRTASFGSMWSKISQHLDPVCLINHYYFKHMVHSIVYLVLRWFQPFDIKIGQHLYLKTIC